MALDGDLAAYSRLCLDTLLARPIGLLSILEEEVKFPSANKSRWFSVGIFKYKPGCCYNSSALIGGNYSIQDWRANLVKDFFLTNKISTNERSGILTGHVTFKLFYNRI